MRLVAGVDIGNATTEIVIADASTLRPLAWDRVRTRGLKGSVEASRGAGRLLTRLETRNGWRVDTAILTRQSPVLTRRLDLPMHPPSTGRLRLAAEPSSTPGGCGFAVGQPVDLEACGDRLPDGLDGPIIAVSRDPLGYLRTATTLRRWLDSGVDVRGVVLTGDEATLVSQRIVEPLPIVDGVDADVALSAARLAVEVAPAGHTCRHASDPLLLAASLNLNLDEHHHARTIASLVTGHRSAAIACLAESMPDVEGPNAGHVVFADGSLRPIPESITCIEMGQPPIRGYLDAEGICIDASDIWLVDPAVLESIPGLRRDRASLTRLALSSIERQVDASDHIRGLSETWSGEVRVVATETAAAWHGAVSSPGIAPDATVIDLGGGTIDIIPASGSARTPGTSTAVTSIDQAWTGAGCGDLMTMATAIATGSSRAAAEWVKRGPAWRIEGPHLAIDESGDRRFLDKPAAQGSVGWLVTTGPGGDLPFSRTLTGSEWRTIRLALKQWVFGRNLARGLRRLAIEPASDIVLVGGPAGDDEIVEAMHAVLPQASIGRANVSGSLGHRWSVAYGLILLDSSLRHSCRYPAQTSS